MTISREQLDWGRRHCAGLNVDLRLQVYRELQGQYDKIVPVGLFEHVGPLNHAIYLDTVQRLLSPEGLFLLRSIGLDAPGGATDAWIDRYVFPNSGLPAASEITQALEGRFILEDWHNVGADYDRTLMSWWANFEAAWPRLAPHYSARFYRQWRYYLLVCAGLFRSRQGQLWQLVPTHRGRQAVYRSVRA